MFISYDRPALTWAMLSSPNNDAAFVTSSRCLSDGKVSVPTRITWDTGAQSGTDLVALIGTFGTAMPIAAGDLVAFAVLFPKTQYAVPAGVTLSFLIKGTSSQPIGSPSVVTFNNGATGFVLVYQIAAIDIHDIGSSLTGIIVEIVNNNGVTTWAAPGQTIDVGEVYFGKLVEFKGTPDPQYSLVDPTTNRRSHNNTPQPLYGKPYRQLTTALPPISDSSAYSGSNNWDYVRNQLAQAPAVLAIPRVYVRGTTTQDANAINQLSIFGRPDSIGALAAVHDATGLWTVPQITISEAPP